MTTSYTAPIQAQGLATHFKFADFALRCARAIDIASTQRHEPLDTPIREETLDPALIERVRTAALELAEAHERTDPEWVGHWSTHTMATTEAQDRAKRDADHLRRRYKAMLADVEAWEPPTEMHTGLKTFMREQLTESLTADCTPSPLAPTTYATAAKYREAELHRLTTNLDHHRLQLHEAQARVARQNDWIRTLWASLATHPHTTALAAEEG